MTPHFPDAKGSEHAANNSPSVNGRLGLTRRRAMIVHGSLVLFGLAIVGRSVQRQLLERAHWQHIAETQQVKQKDITPPRGRILDATGAVLVESRELMRLNISPRELRKSKRFANPRATLRTGLRALNVPDSLIRRTLDTTRKAVLLPEQYLPSDVERFAGMNGVYRQRVLRRTRATLPGLRTVLGEINSQDVAKGGIEQELDGLLRGVTGRDALLSDGRGNLIETPQLEGVAARPGHTVTVTINQSLQDIAERQLALAIKTTGASGGDVVIIDPRDGSVLVVAGSRDRKPSVTSTAMTEPYEAGSVMKPFLVSRLLDQKKTRVDETINTENGTFRFAKRTIFDEHKAASMTVRDVIRLSSNIGVAKLSQRFTRAEQYQALRDFGFGGYTGLPYPSESRGILRTPRTWDDMTPASMAMGYEVAATPMQIAVAYASIANGGELLQPALVRAIHDADGREVFQHRRRVVRRVMSEETAREMRVMLQSVVDSGTAQAAVLSTYDVAGKSGTARRMEGKSYGRGKYNSTFAGMFPAQAPQYVFVARLIDPVGKIYGGTVSGGMMNGILQAALATRESSLDRNALAAVAKPMPAPVVKPRTPQQLLAATRDSIRFDSLRAPMPAPAEPMAAAARVVVSLPVNEPAATDARRRGAKDSRSRIVSAEPRDMRVVPTVYGLDVRQAVRTLHAAGFQVRIARGTEGRTRPASGALVRVGATVTLESPQ